MSNCVSCNASSSTVIKTGVDCGINNSTAGDCALDENGYPIVTPPASGSGCITQPNGATVCPDMEPCSYWDLTTTGDSCIVDSYIEEQLNISGAPINVHKMLGIHEQAMLSDTLGAGNGISSGDMPNFDVNKAFSLNESIEWRSAVTGQAVLGKSFIGYDFGSIKLDNGRDKYGVETAIKHDVSTIKIQQGCDSKNRVTKARVERSNDGQTWYGAALINLPDCDGLVTISFKKSVPSRYWRIRPVAFNGGINDYWTVVVLQLSDYESTEIGNIQDRILLENRDRDYQVIPLRIKGIYTPVDVQAMASKFGFFQTDVYNIQVSISQTLKLLGRPFAIGDIIELPAEQMLSLYNKPIKKYLIINDVALYTGGYTQSWTPTMLRLLAVPAMQSQETQQLFGKLTQDIDTSGLSDINDGLAQTYQDITGISQTIRARANDLVPERGEDTTGLTQFTKEAYDYADKNNFKLENIKTRASVIGHDAMPPNGKPYTEGYTLPDSGVRGQYFRLIYPESANIPARLYRYELSSSGGGWQLIDVDRRSEFKQTKPLNQEFIDNGKKDDTIIDRLT